MHRHDTLCHSAITKKNVRPVLSEVQSGVNAAAVETGVPPLPQHVSERRDGCMNELVE